MLDRILNHILFKKSDLKGRIGKELTGEASRAEQTRLVISKVLFVWILEVVESLKDILGVFVGFAKNNAVRIF